MAKANQNHYDPGPNPRPRNPAKSTMPENFKRLHTILRGLSESSQEIMPLFSAAIDLATKILRMYERAFEAGKKYALKK